MFAAITAQASTARVNINIEIPVQLGLAADVDKFKHAQITTPHVSPKKC